MVEQVKKELMQHGFRLSDDKVHGLVVYLELLLKWNRVMNLVGRNDWRVVLNDLVVDSFFLDSFLSGIFQAKDDATMFDLGAGAGLPGIPLRLVWKYGTFYLVESRTKRAVFMNQAIVAMNLENTFVLNCRVQDVSPELLPASLVISRAFMPWPQLLPLAEAMLASNGVLVIMSSRDYQGQDLPGFHLMDVMQYQANRKTRYFWALCSNI